MFAWIAGLIASLWASSVSLTETLLGYIQTAVNYLIAAVADMLPESVMDGSFLGIDWNILYSLGDALFYIFPFTGLVLLFTTTYGIVASIRLTRWCIGFIPTIEG
jgi:hypothetical protein